MRAWRKSSKLEPAASQRRGAAVRQRRNAAAPRGGGRSCRQRFRSCSELLGRPRGAALSARPLRNQLRSGITQVGRYLIIGLYFHVFAFIGATISSLGTIWNINATQSETAVLEYNIHISE